MTAFDQFWHLPIEEGQQKRADMSAIDVGIRHDNDLVIAKLIGVEFLTSDACTKRSNEVDDRLAGQHLVETGALNVKDLAPQG